MKESYKGLKEKLGIKNSNDERNIILDKLEKCILSSKKAHDLYKKYRGEFQQAQREKTKTENELIGFNRGLHG